MLAPGTGKTQTARLWTYARDERPWGGQAPPTAWYRFSGDRRGQHPKDHLAQFRGWMHADGYAGLNDLYRSGTIREVACMAHVRRKFVDVHRSQGSPIAEDAIRRIAQLYAVEKEARGSPPDQRRDLRQALAAPVFDDFEVWLAIQLARVSGKSPLAAAIRYALTRMERMQWPTASSNWTITQPSVECARLRSRGHSAHVGQDVEVCYRWHALYGRRVRRQYAERRAGGEVVHVEAAPGVVIVVAAWMLDPGACAGMTFGAPRVSIAALAELHQLLIERGFRRSSLDDSTIAQEEQDEKAADIAASRAASTQHAVRLERAPWDQRLGPADSTRSVDPPPAGGRRRHGGGG